MAKKKIWEKKNPERKRKHLTPKQKAEAERSAKQGGRSTPSLVDNINARKSTKKKKKRTKK
jgi:hypothetical protein